MRTPYNQNLIRRHAAIIAVGLLAGCGKPAVETPPAAAPTATPGTATNLAPTAAPVAGPAWATLKSRWLRPDGGYILDIRSVDATSGKLEAAYLNPRPINVFKAQAARDGASLVVLIELRDVNYPGSTYTLTYDPASDQLTGIYYQALQQQSFEVFFTRVKP